MQTRQQTNDEEEIGQHRPVPMCECGLKAEEQAEPSQISTLWTVTVFRIQLCCVRIGQGVFSTR